MISLWFRKNPPMITPNRTPKVRLAIELLEDRTLLSAAQYVPNELLVKFKDGIAEAEKADVRALVKAFRAEHIQTDAMRDAGYGNLEVLRGSADVFAAVAALKNNPLVAFAEPNWILSHQAVSDDPYYTNGNLWGMYSDDLPSAVGPNGTTNQFGSQAEKAWAAGFTGSKTVYVGIIDEGIQFTHPDLIDNVWTNPFDPAGDGIDNDGNGYIDDTHGWDFVSGNNTIYDGTSDDHGTHVAGTIAAKGGNAIGVAGVNWDVTYISGKFLGPNGGSLANAIKAIDYMTDLKVRHGLNIVATNHSWGGGGFSQGLLDAIIRGANANILFIAAAGNNGGNNDSFPFYPASYDTTAGAGYDAVISVAAIAADGTLASFSNYGATKVDLGAAGVGVYSTVPTNSYNSYNGTSMATPHVTGAAALYASTHAGATAAQIKAAILNTTTPTTSLLGKTVTGGRLNVSALMGEATPAFSITNVTQAEGDAGDTIFTFTVTLSTASTTTVTVDYATADGTAVAGSDYSAIPIAQTLIFLPNETSQTITVTVNGDMTSEANETFLVNLSNAIGATIADSQGVGTILNDDDGVLSVNNVTKAEGNSGTTAFTFTVSLQYATTKTVTVDYATADGTATAGSGDYTAVPLTTLTFAPGETSKTVIVNVNGDTSVELDETFFLNLSNAVNAAIGNGPGIGTILDDDKLPGLTITDVSKAEGNRNTTVFTFTVTLANASTSTVTVQYATANGTATSSGSSKDYTATSGTLTFTAGQTTKTIIVSVKGDTRAEANETFFVNLSNPTNATLADSQGVGTIVNDDGGAASLSVFDDAASSFPIPSSVAAFNPAVLPIPTASPTESAGGSGTANKLNKNAAQTSGPPLTAGKASTDAIDAFWGDVSVDDADLLQTI